MSRILATNLFIYSFILFSHISFCITVDITFIVFFIVNISSILFLIRLNSSITLNICSKYFPSRRNKTIIIIAIIKIINSSKTKLRESNNQTIFFLLLILIAFWFYAMWSILFCKYVCWCLYWGIAMLYIVYAYMTYTGAQPWSF